MNLEPPVMRFGGVLVPLAAFDLHLDLEIRGRVCAIFGPSGAGKTSLLDLIAGLRNPSRGRLELGGTCMNDAASGFNVPPERRRIGYVPQDGALFPHLSVQANLLYGHRRRSTVAPMRAALSFEEIVEALDIRPILTRRSIGVLSAGERQRVALARALLTDPQLLLLDEPLANLDAALKARILPYLLRVQDSFHVPMLLVTHSPAEVMALCDEAIILERGKVIQQGPPEELFVERIDPVWVRRA